VPIQLPIGAEDNFQGVVDLVTMKATIWSDDQSKMGQEFEIVDIPADMVEKAEAYREKLIEAISECDDALMEKFMEGEALTEEEIRAGIKKATLAITMIPMTCGTSFKNKGVQTLLDAVINYLPAPTEVAEIKGEYENGDQVVVESTDNGPLAALAFKVMTDRFVGQLTFVRVYRGVLESGSYVYNTTKEKKERVGRLVKMHANKREEITALYAGEIGAVVGLQSTLTGDTLASDKDKVILERMEFPNPVISVAVEPKTKADQEKMGIALNKLAEEDPSFRVSTDEESGQTLIAGMGELHLEIIVDRMKREFKVEAEVGAPQVAYRETIRSSVNKEYKYAKQSGGRGQFGHVYLKIEPQEPGSGYTFVDEIKGGVIPKEYVPAVDKGIQEAMTRGIQAGYPVEDIKVTLYDGSYHEVDSSEMAFKLAGSMGFREGARAANPVILEPIMKVEVEVPEDFMGDVIGDISKRRGQVNGMNERSGNKIVDAFVPLSEMFGYSTDLRSMTQGRATYAMEFDHYEEVPVNISKEIIAKRNG